MTKKNQKQAEKKPAKGHSVVHTKWSPCRADCVAHHDYPVSLRALGVEKFLTELNAPAGFAKECYEEAQQWYGKSTPIPAVRFTGDGIEIKLEIPDPLPPAEAYGAGTGHVSFDTSKGRMTFDRRGVDDSFYVEAHDTLASTEAKLAAQVKRVAESRARLDRSLTVPELGYNLTPEQLAAHQETLRKGGTVTLAPAGFGTGHLLRTRRSFYGKLASAAISNFFGGGPLFVETFDHD